MKTSATDPLFASCRLGDLELRNRLVMAPMTRSRATPEHVPTELMATYYAQRASAGLIISEGTSPSPNGSGYARIPGIFNEEQVRAWRRVTAAVHRQGGRLFMQLMHTGRVSHPLNMPPDARVLAPSAVGLAGTMWTDAQGAQPYPVPAAMTDSDIRAAISEYAAAAAKAVEAGCDGVEIHGANGYLVDQFLNTASNRRTDAWGGSVTNRLRFAVEVATAVANRIGPARVGLRVSPYGVFNDMAPDPAMDSLYAQLADAASALGLVYLHIVDHSSMGAPPVKPEIKQTLRTHFKGALILSGGYDRQRAAQDLAAGKGDLFAFGRPFIANPDLPRRLQAGLALATPNSDTFYTPGAQGYTDYAAAE